MLEDLIQEFKLKGELYIRIRVRPGAAVTEATEVIPDGTIKVAIAAQPVKGQANRELINYLARMFKRDGRRVKIISGKNERTKLIKIT